MQKLVPPSKNIRYSFWQSTPLFFHVEAEKFFWLFFHESAVFTVSRPSASFHRLKFHFFFKHFFFTNRARRKTNENIYKRGKRKNFNQKIPLAHPFIHLTINTINFFARRFVSTTKLSTIFFHNKIQPPLHNFISNITF